jgi:hypothetical protein
MANTEEVKRKLRGYTEMTRDIIDRAKQWSTGQLSAHVKDDPAAIIVGNFILDQLDTWERDGMSVEDINDGIYNYVYEGEILDDLHSYFKSVMRDF